MTEAEVDGWSEELLLNSNIRQGLDDPRSEEEAVRSFDRYVELVDMIQGDEPPSAFHALVDSIRAPHDFGAYEAVHNALWRFPPERFAECMVKALPELIARMAKHDQVGRFLCPLIGHGSLDYLPAFKRELNKLPPPQREVIATFVRENDEWFDDEPERLLG